MKTRSVGELVRIRTDLKAGQSYNYVFCSIGMKSYCGKYLVIERIERRIIGVSYKMFGNDWMWSEAMIDDSFDEDDELAKIETSELFSSLGINI